MDEGTAQEIESTHQYITIEDQAYPETLRRFQHHWSCFTKEI